MWRQQRSDKALAIGPDTEDPLAAIDQFRHWIANADTKAGFLVASITVLISAVAGQRNEIAENFPPTRVTEWIGLGLLSVGALSAFAAALLAARCLTPKVKRTAFTRYSWPLVARAEIDYLVALPAESRRREAWITAKALAQIAESKYGLLQWGIRAFFISALSIVAALTVLTV